MPMVTVPRSRPTGESYRSNAEDAMVVLALVLAGVLGLVIFVVVGMELLDLLPARIHTLVAVSVLTFAVVVAWAIAGRIFSFPRAMRRDVPVVRFRRR